MKKSLIELLQKTGNTLSTGLLALAISCSSGSNSPPNQLPTITITKEFKNDGDVDYTVIANDTNGEIVEINTKFNDEPYKSHNSDNVKLTRTISRKTNILEACAVDNLGAQSTILKDLTEIPDAKSAYIQIKEMLDRNRRFQSYLSDKDRIPIYLDNSQYNVNFLITRNDGRFSVINNVSLNDNLLEEKFNQSALSSYYVDNLYLFRLPREEVTKYIKEFINSRYLSDFE